MTKLTSRKILVILAILLAVVGSPLFGDALAQVAAPTLGTAESFGVLAGSAVTNTGDTVVTGDLGVWPGTAVTGFDPPGIVNGTIYAGDAVAEQAQSDVTTAYNDLEGRPCDTDLTGQDLGGLTLVAGVYCFDSSAQLTGQLTLDAEGIADAVFIFQIGSTLTTASASSVIMINGGNECNVFWQVGSSATLGTTTDFIGSILALTSITMNTDANIFGRILARNGAVTLDDNNITVCADPTSVSGARISGSSNSSSGSSGVGIDMIGLWLVLLLLVVGTLGVAWWARRERTNTIK